MKSTSAEALTEQIDAQQKSLLKKDDPLRIIPDYTGKSHTE